jgi:hypothetical protein
LEEVARRSSLKYAIDFQTAEVHASMRDPEMEQGAQGLLTSQADIMAATTLVG